MAVWAAGIRKCAAELGNNNFFINGEVTGGRPSVHSTCQSEQVISWNRACAQFVTFQRTWSNSGSPTPWFWQGGERHYFLRKAPLNGPDSVAFHYSMYRSFQRFLGLDGNLQVGYDIPVNFIDAWNTPFVENDFINAFTGMSNFDILRWDGLVNGT